VQLVEASLEQHGLFAVHVFRPVGQAEGEAVVPVVLGFCITGQRRGGEDAPARLGQPGALPPGERTP